MAFESVKRMFRPDPLRPVADRLYADCVSAARQPAFYTDLGVPDTMPGRYDMLMLHVFLVVRRLSRGGERDPLGQAVFDRMMRDLDDTYREEGFGDSKVARRVREGAEHFYGRALAYRLALDSADDVALANALARNVYGSEGEPGAKALADHVRRIDALLDEASLRNGRAAFPAPR